MLEVKNLTQLYGDQKILNGIDFKINPGEVAALIGPSGSGKSTLVRCLSLLEAPTAGEILIRGKPASKLDDFPIGVVFQGFNLFPHMTVIQNLVYAPICNKRLTRKQASEKAEKLLDQAGLSHRCLSYPKTLSGGEKQRVAILRALMMNPQILLLDEPTSALDPQRTEELAKMLQSLAKEGITLLIITHEMQLVEKLASRVLILENGFCRQLTGPMLLREQKNYSPS